MQNKNTIDLKDYGFIVADEAGFSFDHEKKVSLELPSEKTQELCVDKFPVLARLDGSDGTLHLKSPVFRYVNQNISDEPYQSAFYAFDNLTKQNIIPVYIAATGEVKDLKHILDDAQRASFGHLAKHLRRKYLREDIRHPQKYFLKDLDSQIATTELDMSDAEVLALFGRLPKAFEAEFQPRDTAEFIPEKLRNIG